MPINYKPVGWDTTKFVNPTNMNQMDDGIKAACDSVDSLTVEVSTISESTDVTEQSYGGYTYNAETGYVNSLQPMIYNAVVEVLGRLSTDIGQLAIAHNAVNGSLANLDGLTTSYEELANITIDGTLYESCAVKIKSVILTNAITASRNIKIGSMISTTDGTLYAKFVNTGRLLVQRMIDGTWGDWESVVLNSDLAVQHITSHATLNSKLSSTYTKVTRSGNVVTVTLRCDSELLGSENMITGLPNPLTHLLGIPLINSSSGATDGFMNMYTGESGAILQNMIAKTVASRVCTFTYVCQ